MKANEFVGGSFSDYNSKLIKRKADSRIYTKHQSLGLLIAELLDDFQHKSLYIKLAKDRDPDELLEIAKNISKMQNLRNKGSYFMSVVYKNKKSKDKTIK